MKTITTILVWLGILAALVSLYLFCKVTCAPVKQYAGYRLHDTCIIAAFALSVFIHLLRAVVTKFWNKKIYH